MRKEPKSMRSQSRIGRVGGASFSRRAQLFGVPITILCGALASGLAQAQSFSACPDGTDICSTPSTANVGIGMSSPLAALDVAASPTDSSIRTGGLEIGSLSATNNWYASNLYFNSGWIYRETGYGDVIHFSNGNIVFQTMASGTAGASATPNNVMEIQNGGNIGIGTQSPGYLLSNTNVSINDAAPTGLAGTSIGWNVNAAGYAAGIKQTSTVGNAQGLIVAIAGTSAANRILDLNSNGADEFIVTGTGNVGIGTTSPVHPLQVAGIIGAEEVIVSSTGADYVFRPDYHLSALSELAGYIKANHHLPGIPSAEESQVKGVSLGDMQTKVLAKVEELTLHMIQADQENQELRARIARLEAQAANGTGKSASDATGH
jgi:hypothetical protein